MDMPSQCTIVRAMGRCYSWRWKYVYNIIICEDDEMIASLQYRKVYI
jgi:hypothetical protein